MNLPYFPYDRGHKLGLKGAFLQPRIDVLKVADGLLLLVEELDFLVAVVHFRDGPVEFSQSILLSEEEPLAAAHHKAGDEDSGRDNEKHHGGHQTIDGEHHDKGQNYLQDAA